MFFLTSQTGKKMQEKYWGKQDLLFSVLIHNSSLKIHAFQPNLEIAIYLLKSAQKP